MDVEAVRKAVAGAGRSTRPTSGTRAAAQPATEAGDGPPLVDPETGQIAQVGTRPNPRDPVVRAEALSLGVLLQASAVIAEDPRAMEIYADLGAETYSVPQYRAVFDAIRAAGGPGAASADFVAAVSEEAGDAMAGIVSELAVTPLPHDKPAELARYARSLLSRMLDLALTRQIADMRGSMQRAGEGTPGAQEAFGQLVALEQRRRALRDE